MIRSRVSVGIGRPPASVEATLHDGMARMIPRVGSSGKSIVMIVTIRYFLSHHDRPARPSPRTPGGRAPRQLLARGARAAAHPAGREHAGASARADARAAAAG